MYRQRQVDSGDAKQRRPTGQITQRIAAAAIERRVQELRQKISDDLWRGLSHDVASVLVIDGGARSCWQLSETVLRVAHRPGAMQA